MKNACNKGLLIPWLLKALNEQLYQGLRWSDKQRKIFYIIWTHKSAEQWSIDVLEPFKAWAEHKGKLTGKNEKQLKATFRCALNSKKEELREVYRNRSRRYWQFVDPNSGDGKIVNKKKRKLNSKQSDAIPVGISNDSIGSTFMNCSSSTTDCSGEDFFKSSEEKIPKKKKPKVNRKLVDDITIRAPPNDISNSFTSYSHSTPSSENTENSTIDKLPPFQSFCSFQPLTPPYQDFEIPYSSTEYSTVYNTPPPDRLTPPADIPIKDYHNTSCYNSFEQQLSSDIWQPNCWTISTVQQQGFNSLNPFVSHEFDDMGKLVSQDIDCNKIDFLEVDQSVPIMNMSTPVRTEHFNYTSRSVNENNQCEEVKFDDYYLFTNDDNQECERIIQELNRLPSSPDVRTYNYVS